MLFDMQVVGSKTTLRCWVSPLHCWVSLFHHLVIPSPLGPTLCCWVLPFVIWLYLTVGFHPFIVGSTLRRWVLLFVVGSYSSLLGPTLHHWVLPFVVWLYPRCWVSPFCCLVIPSPLGPTLLISAPAPPLCCVIAPPLRRVAPCCRSSSVSPFIAVVVPLAGIEFLPTLSNLFGCRRIRC
jgi:hypothetical protein